MDVFFAFLGFFLPDNLGKTHLSPDSAKKEEKPFWTSPESICGKLNEHLPITTDPFATATTATLS